MHWFYYRTSYKRNWILLKSYKGKSYCLYWYNRIAFFGKEDKDFRLTIDSKIITCREDLFLESGCHGTDILKPNEYLMEVKILDAIPMWLAEIFSELKIYNTHFSKYGNEYMTYCQEQNNHNKNRREKIC